MPGQYSEVCAFLPHYTCRKQCVLTPNALGVKLRLAATEPRPRLPSRAARCQLQLLVGLTRTNPVRRGFLLPPMEIMPGGAPRHPACGPIGSLISGA